MFPFFLAYALADPTTLGAAGGPPSEHPSAPGVLDGRVFLVVVQDPTAGEKPETFVFETGTFDARESHQWGFTPAVYTTTLNGDAITFTATLSSPTAGAILWTGTVTGDVLSGYAEWTRKGRSTVHYAFEGKAKK